MATINESRLNEVQDNACSILSRSFVAISEENELSEVQDNACSNKQLFINLDESLQRVFGEEDIKSPLRQSFNMIYGDDYDEMHIETAISIENLDKVSEVMSDVHSDTSSSEQREEVSVDEYMAFSEVSLEYGNFYNATRPRCLCGTRFYCRYHDACPFECICETCRPEFYTHVRVKPYMMHKNEWRVQSSDEDVLPENVEKLIDVIEDLWIAYENIMSSKKENQVRVLIINVIDFVKKQAQLSPAKLCAKMALEFLRKEELTTTEVSVQSFEENVNTVAHLFGKYTNLTESVLTHKLKKCMMFCLTFALFEKFGISFETFGYSVMEKRATMKKFSNKAEFVQSAIDLTLFVLQRGIQIFKTGDFNTIFHSSSTYDEIYVQCQVLSRQFKFLDNPEALGFTESSFRGDLDAIIEKLQSMKKHSAGLSSFDRRAITAKLDEMLLMQDELNCRAHAMQARDAPFSIMLYGDSGVGKSTLVECLYQYFCKLQNLPNGSEYKFVLNAIAKYWDNFRSQVHTLVVDDIACENPDNADSASSVTELIRICNNIPYCPDQAALENKGKTPLRVKFVIATSNSINMNAHVYGACPSAIQRRLPIIVQPKVKPEYRAENGKNLDPSKIDDAGAFPDLWTYDIFVVDPVELDPRLSKQKLAVPRLLKKDLNQREFYSYLKNEVEKYSNTQLAVKHSVRSTANAQLCRCCQMPPGCCLQVQAGDEVIRNWFLTISLLGFLRWFFASPNRTGLWLIFVNFFTDWWHRDLTYARRNATMHYIRLRLNREYFASIGRRVCANLTPELVAKYTMWMATIYFLKKIASAQRIVQASDVLSSKDIGKVPMSEINSRENVWYNNDVELTSADFTRPSSSAKNVSFDEFSHKVAANTISFGVYHSGNKRRNGVAVCLYGQVYVTCNHNIPKFEESTKLLVRSTKDKGVAPEWEGIICEDDVYRCPEKDLAIIVLRNIRPRKDIFKYILKGSGAGVFKGKTIVRQRDGSLRYENTAKISSSHVTLSGNGLTQHRCERFIGYPNRTLEDGDCGAPMIIETGSAYAIVGIHVASSTDGCIISNALTHEILDPLIDKLKEPRVQSGNMSMISAPSAPRIVGELHKKSVFRYLQGGTLEIYGSFKDFRGNHTSRVEKTPMNPLLAKHGYQTKFGKPEMKSWVPWHIGARDIVDPITTLRTDILRSCADAYIDHLVDQIGVDQIRDIVHPLDDFTAVNGAQSVFIDKINRNSSMGNPYKKSKKYFLQKIPPAHGMLDPVKFDAEIMDRVDYICGEYSEGRMVHPNFCAHLKDEPVSQKKMATGKTRVFTGAPGDWSIVNRKLLLTTCKLFQTYRIESMNACGTIAQSLEWEELRNFLTKFGDENMVAGDYASFDKKMAPCEILNAFYIIIRLCELSGNYTEQEIKMIWCLAMDTAFPTVDYNGDLVGLYGSNPAGHPLTVIINGIVGIIRMMYAYRELHPEKTIVDFFKFVALVVYGDDNAMGVHKSIPWFNHTSISEYLAKHNIVYTMADKESKSIPYIHIDDVSFLKRRWVYNDEVGAYLAPLDHTSIEKMLMTWTKSKTICTEAQGIAVISSAMMEYFFYGRKTFEKRQLMLKQLVQDLGWGQYVEESTFPSFENLVDRFQKSSRHTSLYVTKDWSL